MKYYKLGHCLKQIHREQTTGNVIIFFKFSKAEFKFQHKCLQNRIFAQEQEGIARTLEVNVLITRDLRDNKRPESILKYNFIPSTPTD